MSAGSSRPSWPGCSSCRSLTPLFGSDAVVWTQDAAELDQEQSLDLMAWIARTLVEATIRDP